MKGGEDLLWVLVWFSLCEVGLWVGCRWYLEGRRGVPGCYVALLPGRWD